MGKHRLFFEWKLFLVTLVTRVFIAHRLSIIPSTSSRLRVLSFPSILPPLCRFLPPPVRDPSRIFVIVGRNPVHRFPSRSGNHSSVSTSNNSSHSINYKSNIWFHHSLPLHSIFLFHVPLSTADLFSSSISFIKYIKLLLICSHNSLLLSSLFYYP